MFEIHSWLLVAEVEARIESSREAFRTGWGDLMIFEL
jgi:hypothetical protein